jgi:hypothetical protein
MVDILKTMANKHIEFSFLMDETGFMRVKADKKGSLSYKIATVDEILSKENPENYFNTMLCQIIKEVEE